MKTPIKAAVLALVLALALPAAASAKKAIYGGTTDGEGQIAFTVKTDKKGKPKGLQSFRFTNVPLDCEISGPHSQTGTTGANAALAKPPLPIANRKFDVRFTQDGYKNESTIDGKFKSKKKLKGVLDYSWHYLEQQDDPATPENEYLPEEDCTAQVNYTAKRGGPDVELPPARAQARRR